MRLHTSPDDRLAGSLADEAGTLDLGAAAASLWSRRRWILLPTLAALVLSAAAVQVIRPVYKSTAQVLLQSQESTFTRPTSEQVPQQGDAAIDDSAVGSQVQVILSRDLAHQAIQRLGLGSNPDFDPLAREPGPLEQLWRRLGLVKDVSGKGHDERVLDSYVEALSVYPLDKSRVIAIEFSARDPELAAQAANTIAALFIETQQTAKRRASQVASDNLSPQIDELRKRVAKAEAAVEAYRSRNGLFVAQNTASLAQQQLADIATQLSNARSQQTDAQVRAKMIRSLVAANRPVELSDVTNNELVRRLVEQRVGLQAQLAQESRTLLPQHPRIKELQAQLAGLQEQVQAEALRTARSLENDAAMAGSRVDVLKQDFDGQKAASATSNEQGVALRALELEAKTDRDILESSLTRYREATSRAALADLPADARVVSGAVPPTTPYFPKKGPIILIATLLAFVLCCTLVSMIQLLAAPSGRQRAGQPLLRVTEPAVWTERPDVQRPAPVSDRPLAASSTFTVPTHPVLDALAARLRASDEAGHCILLDTLDEDGEASRAATQLAQSLATRHMSAVILDLDQASEDRGFGELLAGTATFTDVIERRAGSPAHGMALGDLPVLEPAVAADRTTFVLDALASTYDVAIIASGPTFRSALQPCLASIAAECDEVLLITEADIGDEAVADRRSKLTEAGATLITLVAPLSLPGGQRAAA